MTGKQWAEWTCDVCGDVARVQGSGLPTNWAELQLPVGDMATRSIYGVECCSPCMDDLVAWRKRKAGTRGSTQGGR